MKKIIFLSALFLVNVALFGQVYNWESNNSIKSFRNLKTEVYKLDSIFYSTSNIVDSLSFDLKRKTIKTYTDSSITYLEYDYDTLNGIWNIDRKYVMIYNEFENRISNTFYNWNTETNKWDFSSKTKNDYIYDNNGNCTEYSSSTFDTITDTWILLGKYNNSFDEKNNNIENIYFSWSKDIQDWVKLSKTEIIYDSFSKDSLRFYYYWKSSLNNWTAVDKTEYFYDDNKNKILSIKYSWDSYLNTWSKYTKDENIFNEIGNNITNIFSTWNSNVNDWVMWSKNEYSYDENNNSTLQIGYQYNLSSNIWKYTNKFENFWSILPSAISPLPTTKSFKIFPNPTTKNINITVPKTEKETNVEIFNLNGQKVYSLNIHSENVNIALPNLNKGMYLVKFTNEEFVKTEKLVIE